MNEAKFTPGPWRTDTISGTIVFDKDKVLGLEVSVHISSDPFDGFKKAQANACLISAAPDMHEALQAALCDDPDWRQLAVDALAKAEGRAKKASA